MTRQGFTPELYEANYAAWLDDTHSPHGVRQPTSSAVLTVRPTATIQQRVIDTARVQPSSPIVSLSLPRRLFAIQTVPESPER